MTLASHAGRCYCRDMGDDVEAFLRNFAAVAEAAQNAGVAQHHGEQLWDAVETHLGGEVSSLPVVTEEFGGHRLTDASILLEALGAEKGARVAGLAGEVRHHMSLTDMLQGRRFQSVPIVEADYVSVAVGPCEQRRVVVFGLFLVQWDESPLAVLLRGAAPQFGRPGGTLEIVGRDPRVVDSFTGWFRARLQSESIFRGQVVSFTANEYEATSAGVTFHRRPRLSAADVVLPQGLLERVEGHVVGLGTHRDELLRRGQHLKRGVLLYGPPGTGKTHTVRYLLSKSEGTTSILLSGGSLALVSEAARMARALQPALVVLEDCDLVAEDRSFGHGPQPLLFELLDAMDGLDADADVAFVLTTNRVDMLERALAQRPGRVDLAVEIPRPDQAQRRELLRLYASGIGFGGGALDRAAAETEGTTASLAKELVRRAVLAAVTAGAEPADEHLSAAVAELMADGAVLTRALLGGDGTAGLEDGSDGDEEVVSFGFLGDPPTESGAYFAYAPSSGTAYGPAFPATDDAGSRTSPGARDADAAEDG